MKEYFVWLMKFITVIIVFFVVVPILILSVLMASSKTINTENIIPQEKNLVAVIDVNGIIMDSKDVVEKLYKFSSDEKFKGIILKVNSPGGAVAPSQDIYNTILKLKSKKPIYAVMDSMAASGGYYVSAPCTKIYAQKGTMTASIGVISQFVNFKNLSEWFGLKIETVKSGKLKDFGSPYRDMTDEERGYWQNMSNTIHEDFIQDVAKARNIDVNKLREVADGRVLIGTKAKEANLIDEIGGINDASVAMFKELNIKLGENEMPKLYYTENKLKEFKKLLNQSLSFFSRSQQGVRLMYLN
ncbi:MAG: signal peptide peptidase SppA [Bdellovibrionota bacterium]|nr:signal peptide peptidase SppA [Pseudomonadota bacterium]MDY6090360.1 signal peptide peptidase SppA [Bdellovibrionota bacterium]